MTYPDTKTPPRRPFEFDTIDLLSPIVVNRKAIEALLKESDETLRKDITWRWHEAKIQELAYVGVTSAIIASLFGSAFTWPAAASAPWPTLACWYGGLVFTIASIATATQQSVTLHRFSSGADYVIRVRQMLGYRNRAGHMVPRSFQVFVWQIPVMMLRFSVYLFLTGLFLLLWHAARPLGCCWSSPEWKVALMASVIAVSSLIVHGLSVFWVYSRVDLEG